MVDQIALAPGTVKESDGLLASAEQFITQFHAENGLGPPGARLDEVRGEIDKTGTYWHTPAELEFGARVAWRNSSRCIGRLYWHSLRVRDRREVTGAKDVAREAVEHLREATNGGRIRPVITVFAPDMPARPGPRILSSQLIRYAGYETTYGQVFGDPANVGLTRMAHIAGWPGRQPATRFDILPLLIQEPGETPTLHELPRDAVLEVPIEHPGYRWFTHLGLRWHAVPVISDMYLSIGGIRYPAAPFNGWYMGTEIGSRNLGDEGRYGMMPAVAEQMGFPTGNGDLNLWKDRALTELNTAVLWSFAKADVTITDHHTESERFLRHVEREARHGRACPADWTWIVPPAASSACPVFHRTYRDFDQTPNFYRHPTAGVLSGGGGDGGRGGGGPPRPVRWCAATPRAVVVRRGPRPRRRPGAGNLGARLAASGGADRRSASPPLAVYGDPAAGDRRAPAPAAPPGGQPGNPRAGTCRQRRHGPAP